MFINKYVHIEHFTVGIGVVHEKLWCTGTHRSCHQGVYGIYEKSGFSKCLHERMQKF